MPEEKKEKFTFSDKIKASKPAGSKSFAKPVSKIGKDGKPKQTLFERTRRDAPFFIAALVALLLLPFLYKYSGSSGEEELLVPVSEENIFNPDHFGFDTAFTEDPDGQIAQLSGRDSLSLIRGFGSSNEENFGRDDLDFDASSAAADYGYDANADGKYAAAHRESSDMDIEENTTNIYKRRAKKGTRAAFRRAATKIGSLNPAAMRRPGGAGLNVKNWGGGLKNAAQKVKPSAPTEAPKPVSLQPLRARSGRAAFGGTGKAGRASRGALGKADARQALRDANVKPVDPTRVGGLDMFSMGPGGGNGRLERNINIGKGQEPWWWDMMKTRMQKEWEKRFERKWKWIDWADQIAMNILKGLINCILTGDSDGDVDHFLGVSMGSSDGKQECCGIGKSKFDEAKWGTWGKPACDKYKQWRKDIGNPCEEGWKDTSSGGEVRGIIGQRLCCLGFCGAGFKGSASLSIKEGVGLSCANIDDHEYHLQTYQLPRDWQQHTYMYVVARNYRPASLPPLSANAKRGFLCAEDDVFSIGGEFASGVDDAQLPDTRKMKEDPNKHYTSHRTANETSGEQKILSNMYDRNPEAIANGCVIYLQRGNKFNYKNFQMEMVNRFTKMIEKGNYRKAEGDNRSNAAIAADAFEQLDLMFIESFASKYKLAYAKWGETGNNLHQILPMTYGRFHSAFVEHRGSTNKASGSRKNVDKRKQRVWGTDSAMGQRCYFSDSLNIACKDDTEPPQATVTFKPSYKGGQAINLQDEINHLVVTAQYKPLTGSAGAELNMHDGKAITVEKAGDRALLYSLNVKLIKDAAGKEVKVGENEGYNIVWKVYRNASTQDEAHQKVDNKEISPLTATCTYKLYGDVPTPPVQQKQCKNAQESPECCDEIMGSRPHEWDPSKPVGSQCVEKGNECPQGKNTNEACCKKEMGADYMFDPNHNPKCYLPENIQLTRLAPVISWVPSNGKTDCRENAGNEVNPPEGTFSKCPKVPGVVKNNTQKCGSQTPMMMDSSAAAKFVKDVVTAYNKALPAGAKPLSDKFYGGTYPTDGEFIDALFIAAENNLPGLQQVPAAAVCELGRDMVRMSRDPQVGSKQMKTYALGKRCPDSPYAYGQTSSQDKSTCYYTNDLGAFLAYVHPIAMFYPGVWVANNTTCDQRFIGLATNTGNGQACPNATVALNMHHNNYHSMLNKKKDAPDSSAVNSIWSVYSRSLNPSSLASNQPLAAVVSNKAWTDYALYTQCGTNGYKDKCTKAAMKYKKEIEPLLTEASSFQAWQGNACKGFYGGDNGPMVSVAKVLEYVKTVCSVGLDKKPHGIGSSRMGGSGTQSGGSHEGTGTSGTSNNPR